MTPVRLPGKASQIDRFPTEWAMDCGECFNHEKSARYETSAPVSSAEEIVHPVRQTRGTDAEPDPAA